MPVKGSPFTNGPFSDFANLMRAYKDILLENKFRFEALKKFRRVFK